MAAGRCAPSRGSRTLDEAKAALACIEAGVVGGVSLADRAPGLPLRDIMGQWRASLTNRNARNDQARVTRYLLPAFGGLTMEAAQRLHTVMRWLDSLRLAHRDLGGET
jgi:hypothetical protein